MVDNDTFCGGRSSLPLGLDRGDDDDDDDDDGAADDDAVVAYPCTWLTNNWITTARDK